MDEVILDIPFSNERDAITVFKALSVDPEPKRSGITKTLTLTGNTLKVQFKCGELKTLRVSVNTFMDLLYLSVQTIERFAPEKFEN
jgi:hypothetical protein